MSFAPSSVAPTEANAGGGGLVVTGMYVRAGQSVSSGNVIAEVSDRPVYVLQGPLPLWRDLAPGESGKDVMELQTALARLGFSAGYDSYGYFGPGTEAAVRSFYARIGYSPPVKIYAPAAPAPSPSPTASTAASHSPGTTAESGSGQPVYEAIVPMSEAWFVSGLPARVLSVGAHEGDESPSSLVKLVEGGLQLTGQLDPSEVSLIRAGLRVSIFSQITGYRGTGDVASVGEEVNASAVNGGAAYVPVGIRPSGEWPDSLNGQNVEITITAATSGKPVLAVPVAAVSSDASGQTEIVLEEGDGRERTVHVETGMSADGYVAVSDAASALTPGELVVVGQ